MTLEEYILSYDKLSVKEMTKGFNKLSLSDRKDFLNILSDQNKEEFIKSIRTQAVKDFWTHEREAVINGENTRGWTPEQIEKIMNFSDKTGNVLFGKVENHKKGWIICKMLNLL